MMIENIKIDIDEIKKYVNDGLLSMRKHPALDLYVLKYTPEAMFTQKIKEIELLQRCRGLVIDSYGNIIARGMKKFFNMEELTDDQINNIVNGYCEVTKKVDGSCGLLTEYNGEKFFYTLGSFDSEQAIWANNLIKKESSLKDAIDCLDTKQYTYIFELVYSDDAHVVKYNSDFISFIGMVENKTGYEFLHSDEKYVQAEDILMKVPCVELSNLEITGFNGLDVQSLKDMNTENEEGFVLASRNGKMKIKFENYLKKFRTKYMYSDKRIAEDWFNMGIRRQDIDSYIKDIDGDEEIGISARNIINELWDRYNSIYKEVLDEYYNIMCNVLENSFPTRKDFAMAAKDSKYKGYMFLVFDGKWLKLFDAIRSDILKNFK